MPWFIVWSVLVVAAFGVGWALWRRLYRAARATMVEVSRGADVVAGLADQVDALHGAAEPFIPRAGLSHDPVEARARVTALRKEREHRAVRRRRAHAGTYERWDAHSH
jgi:hypothetical protein